MKKGADMDGRKNWTSEDVARLRGFAAEGKSIAQAAEALGRTFASVQKYASKHKIRFHNVGGRPTSNTRTDAPRPTSTDSVRHVCSCGFYSDWPPAFSRHLRSHRDHTEIDPQALHDEPERTTDAAPIRDTVTPPERPFMPAEPEEPLCETRTPSECANEPCDPCELKTAEATYAVDEAEDEHRLLEERASRHTDAPDGATDTLRDLIAAAEEAGMEVKVELTPVVADDARSMRYALIETRLRLVSAILTAERAPVTLRAVVDKELHLCRIGLHRLQDEEV